MNKLVSPLAIVLGVAVVTVGCSPEAQQQQQRQSIKIDGSSTVFPITDAIADTYNETQEDPVEVDVSFSGTGGGFEKFCAGETDINNASRPILEAEMKACDEAGIRFYELPVAFDALTIVVNQENDWVDTITVEELKTLWEPSAEGQVTRWNQVRPSWPDRPITLHGPGLDSGTYDYFAEVIVGKDTRSDFAASEDDEMIAAGVGADPNALGYFGLAYYAEHQDTLKALAVDSSSDPVEPSPETVVTAEYQPLSRPLFIYVNFESTRTNPAVNDLVQFYLENAPETVDEVGYVPLTEEGYHIAWINFQEGEVGSAFDGTPQPNLTITELLRKTKRF
ncbi:MAG: phosphate ABC transporter substrate-binding protein PstS family protein [Cyanobacteria bacterium]|nr:phosphate ABC transporter substrate-binding protein PstS family protein [Cyanobacteria bacterium GSL.Bin1]